MEFFFFPETKSIPTDSLGLVLSAFFFSRDNPELRPAGIWGTALLQSTTPAGWHLEGHQGLLGIPLDKADGKVKGLREFWSLIASFCAERHWVSIRISNTVVIPLHPAFLKCC